MSLSPRPGAARRLTAGALVVLSALAGPTTPAAAAVGSTPDASIETNGDVNAIARSGGSRLPRRRLHARRRPDGPGADLGRERRRAELRVRAPERRRPRSSPTAPAAGTSAARSRASAPVTRNRLAHLLADGSVDPGVRPERLNRTVNALVLSGADALRRRRVHDRQRRRVARNRLAAFDTTTGAATSFNPSANSPVNALALVGHDALRRRQLHDGRRQPDHPQPPRGVRHRDGRGDGLRSRTSTASSGRSPCPGPRSTPAATSRPSTAARPAAASPRSTRRPPWPTSRSTRTSTTP